MVMRQRAGVLAIRHGRIALLERHRAGQHYWVIPGGGVESGETVEAAAAREAAEELGVDVELGPLRVKFDATAPNGAHGQHWYFAATIDTDEIQVVGPELEEDPSAGTYEAVWVALDDLSTCDVRPPEIADLVDRYGEAGWPDDPVVIVTDLR